jgi:hypothetical protein
LASAAALDAAKRVVQAEKAGAMLDSAAAVP